MSVLPYEIARDLREYEMEKNMDLIRILLKIIMWFLIAEFGCNYTLQTISYSFYKKANKMTDISCNPQFIQFNNTLTGYGNNLDSSAIVTEQELQLIWQVPGNVTLWLSLQDTEISRIYIIKSFPYSGGR